MVSTRKTEYDTEEEVGARDRTREPLLNPPANQASGGAHFDLWGARMREKVACSAMNCYFLRKGRLVNSTKSVSKYSFVSILFSTD